MNASVGALRRDSQGDSTLAYGELAAGPQAAPEAAPEQGRLLEEILTSLDDDKAENVVTIDLKGRSTIADAMVVCSGRSSRQVGAIAEKLIDRLKDRCGLVARTEGRDAGDWVLIDAGDVVVHVFRPEVRDFYQLEKMWQPAGATPPPASS